MVKQVIQAIVIATVIRFLVIGGYSDVAAMTVSLAAYFVNSYLNKPSESNDVASLKQEVAQLKEQSGSLEDKVSKLSLAQGFKKMGG